MNDAGWIEMVFEAALAAARSEGFTEDSAIGFAKGYAAGARDGSERGYRRGRQNYNRRKGRANHGWIEPSFEAARAAEPEELTVDGGINFARGYDRGAFRGFERGYRLARQSTKGRKVTQKPAGRQPLMDDWFPGLMMHDVREQSTGTAQERVAQFLHRLRAGSKRLRRWHNSNRKLAPLKSMKLPSSKQAKGIYDRELTREKRIANGCPTKADLRRIALKSLIAL